MKNKFRTLEQILAVISGIFAIYVILAEPQSPIPCNIALLLILIDLLLLVHDYRQAKSYNKLISMSCMGVYLLWFFSDYFKLPHMGYGIKIIKVIAGLLGLATAIWLLRIEIKHKKSLS